MPATSRRPRYAVATWLFLRLLGGVYLAAFWALAVQIRGLVGHDGILPAHDYMAEVADVAALTHTGLDRYRLWPTLCWLSTSDAFLVGLALVGTALAVLLVVGCVSRLVLVCLWVLYLSLSVVCRDFLAFQWDSLLLEAGFLSIWMAPAWRWHRLRDAPDPSPIARWLVWWLHFRLIFSAGLIKLTSGDPTWRGLSALAYHFETQPLPTPLAWYAHRLPVWVLQLSTAAVIGAELVLPWLVFAPRRWRASSAAPLILLQVFIALTGNFAFFNLLSAALAVLLVDDTTCAALWPRSRPHADAERQVDGARWATWVLVPVAVAVLPVSLVVFGSTFGLDVPGAATLAPVTEFVEPLRSINRYGLFAIMTTSRPQIVVEGSEDGRTWWAYDFVAQPGNLNQRPRWMAPYQPRLDWQMWFAALGDYNREVWFRAFCERLLDGSPSVLSLLGRDPFEGRPPRMVRGVLYRYRFADAAAHEASGAWWTRERIGLYSPALARPTAPH